MTDTLHERVTEDATDASIAVATGVNGAPIWMPPLHFPVRPVIAAVFDIRGSSYLTSKPSGLSLRNFRALPP